MCKFDVQKINYVFVTSFFPLEIKYLGDSGMNGSMTNMRTEKEK